MKILEGKETYFYAMADRTRYIQRWSLMRNSQTENIAEHSYQTALIAHALAVIRQVYFPELSPVNAERLVCLALYHDLNEVITGDLPTPIKYHDEEIELAYKKVEELALEDLLSMLPAPMAKIYRDYLLEPSELTEEDEATFALLKAADRIGAYLKCVVEMQQGNLEFQEALLSTKERILALDVPEAQFFLENFTAPFGHSLDTLRSGTADEEEKNAEN